MEQWIEKEMECLEVGDVRRQKRAKVILEGMMKRPKGSLPESAGGSAEMAAIYRMMNNPAVGLKKIVEAHGVATLGRAAGMKTVLCPQDTTFLNYEKQPTIEGLGSYAGKEHGFMVHLTIAATEEGVVLGSLDVQTMLHREGSAGAKRYKAQGIEQKQSMRWLRSLERLNELAPVDESIEQWVSVADREADIYEMFTALRHGRVHWLVRAAYNRATVVAENYLWDEVAKSPLLGEKTVEVHGRADRPGREAVLEVRAQAVGLRPPRRVDRVLPEVEVWAVWAREMDPPPGEEAVEWMLLTDLPVENFAQACEKLQWYGRRWLIERFFYVLKSGCQVESLQLAKRSRLETALGFYLIISWRILWMTLWARVEPKLPATVAFTEAEWKITWIMALKKPLPSTCPTLSEVVAWLAQLGGHQGKSNSKPPGPKAIWSGLQHIQSVRAYQIALENV